MHKKDMSACLCKRISTTPLSRCLQPTAKWCYCDRDTREFAAYLVVAVALFL